DEDRALVRVREKLSSNAAALPPGATPLVQARSINDVPVMALTLWGAAYDNVRLRAMAAKLHEALKEVPDISQVTMIGGRPRQVTVDLDTAALAARGLDPLRVQQALSRANALSGAADLVAGNRDGRVEGGNWPQA